jgi:hypothetical protein
MGSTEVNIGLHGKSSSRVLKPPGGGHSDIFGAPDQVSPAPRPEYNQQNSSNLNQVMNTTDPNVLIKDMKSCPKQDETGRQPPAKSQHISDLNNDGSNNKADNNRGNRVPPGGFSNGLW